MNFKAQVEDLLNKVLEENPKLYLIDIKISNDFKIKIVLDGDNSVSVKDCINVSRAIENNLDRDAIDFSLEVTSVGANEPLIMKRQYYKNIGRKLSVEDNLGIKHEGMLCFVNENDFNIQWKERQNKKTGKGKETVKKEKTFSFSQIIQSKVILKF